MSRAVAIYGTPDRDPTQMFLAVREDGKVFGRRFSRFASDIPDWKPVGAILTINSVVVTDFGSDLDPVVLPRLNSIPMGAITLPE